MGDVFREYSVELSRRDLAPGTRQRYMQVVTTYQKWLQGREPTPLAARDFLAHLRAKGYRPRSVLLYYHALRLLHQFLGQDLKLKLRKPKELPPYYGQEEIEKLITQAGRGLQGQSQQKRKRNQALILTLAYTGMRRGELLRLRVGDIDFKRRVIFIYQGKEDKDRVIPMAQRLVAPLRAQCRGKAKAQLAFAGLNERSVYRVVTSVAKASELDGLHPHSLRHYFATQLVERGANLRAVQELLGHADLETTAVYLDITAQHLRSAVDLLEKEVNEP